MLAETAAYWKRINDLREQIRKIILQLPGDALNWRPDEESDNHAMNSVAVLAMHTVGAEHFWIGEVVGNLPATRNRDAEFEVMMGDTAVLVQTFDKVAQQTLAVLEAITQADLDGARLARGRNVPVRWAILHVIEHTALHLGHMQITVQLWQGG
ncbi:MAG: DUF664 domain-containing protein [Chloroflexi bacterium]|nr:DUF664 domain-containing protein [Chloroflexota bacterium]